MDPLLTATVRTISNLLPTPPVFSSISQLENAVTQAQKTWQAAQSLIESSLQGEAGDAWRYGSQQVHRSLDTLNRHSGEIAHCAQQIEKISQETYHQLLSIAQRFVTECATIISTCGTIGPAVIPALEGSANRALHEAHTTIEQASAQLAPEIARLESITTEAISNPTVTRAESTSPASSAESTAPASSTASPPTTTQPPPSGAEGSQQTPPHTNADAHPKPQRSYPANSPITRTALAPKHKKQCKPRSARLERHISGAAPRPASDLIVQDSPNGHTAKREWRSHELQKHKPLVHQSQRIHSSRGIL